jgi:large subunit ribosomal protein L22
MKRVRPAPMGRAYRVVKRSAHLTVCVAERPVKIARVGSAAGAGKA